MPSSGRRRRPSLIGTTADPMLHKMNRTGVTAEVERGSLVFKTSAKNFVDSIPLEERTLAGRNLWLGKPLYAKTLYI